MSDCTQKPDGTFTPADQPKPPGGDCGKVDPTTPPTLKPPEPCKDSQSSCNCSKTPGTSPTCLEVLIEKQVEQITVADKAKAFKAELEALLTKAKAASVEYNQDKYGKLLKLWQDQDRDIAELIRTLICKVPCWRCIIECYVCPLLNEMHEAEQWLCGDGKHCSEMHNLYDLRYWYERDWEAKKGVLQRIKDVLAVWEKPAQTIDKILSDDAKLVADIGKSLVANPAKAVYDVFLKLVPMHLAIAPPVAPGLDTATKIDKKFTQFCECDTGTPDDCCGPDVGKQSLRRRLIGPQPYLVNPNDYFKIICCLVEHRYLPAKDAAAAAEAAWQAKDNEIKRRQAQIENGLKTFEATAKGAIPIGTRCCGEQVAAGSTSSTGSTPSQAQ